MDDGLLVDVLDGGQDTLCELVFGSNSDVPEHGARQLGEEAFDQIEPGAMLRGEAPIETRCVKSEPFQWRDPNNSAVRLALFEAAPSNQRSFRA